MRNGLNEPRDDFIGTRVGGRRRGYFFVDIFTCLCSNEPIERLFFHYRFIRRGVAALNPADSFFSARVPRKSLSIYDLRFTMYDCQVRARCAEEAERMQSGILKAAIGGS